MDGAPGILVKIFILSSFILFTTCFRKESFEIKRFFCVANPHYIELPAQCNLTYVSRTQKNINVITQLKHPINNVTIQMVLNYRNSPFGKYVKYLVNITEDLCAFLENRNISKLLNVTLESIIHNSISNVAHPCPFSGTVYVKNYAFHPDFFENPILPAGDYRIDIIFRSDQIMFLNSQLFFAEQDGRT